MKPEDPEPDDRNIVAAVMHGPGGGGSGTHVWLEWLVWLAAASRWPSPLSLDLRSSYSAAANRYCSFEPSRRHILFT